VSGGKTHPRNLLTQEGVSTVDWKDAALLRKFISDRGKIRAPE
jgi:small subunit ribosomal protein S18